MRGWTGFVLGLAAALGWTGGATAQESLEGIYVTTEMEMASRLELASEGRFRWFFSYGALDMSAEGRWRRDGDAVVLDTEPPVAPPRVELAGSGTEEGDALVVQIKDATGNTPSYLDVEGRYEDGEAVGATLGETGYAFEPSDRRIVAVRVGSRIFQFWAETASVPAGANRIRFRYDPGELGRADFRGTRATLSGGSLILAVLGEPLTYRPLSAEDQRAVRDALQAAEDAVRDLEAASQGAEGTATDDTWPRCFDVTGELPADQGIAACTALLGGDLVSDDVRAAVLNARGSYRNETRDHDGALADFDEAIQLNPELAEAYWGRGDAHEGLGDFARAAAETRIAARLAPDNPDIQNAFCWHLGLADEDLGAARTACDTALRLRPDDPATLDSRGLTGLRQERYAEAWADYDAAVRHGADHPDLAHFLYGRGIAALRLGRAAEGSADLARARELNDLIADTYARFGIRP